MNTKKLGVALGSGGSRGIAHIGFLQAMEENGLRPSFVTGCSMGAVVGAIYCSGLRPREIYEVMKKIRLTDLFSLNLKRGSLLSTRKMRKILERYLGDKEFKDLKIPFRCVAVDMDEQKLVEFSKGKVLDAVMASTSMPAILEPTEIDGKQLVDGGILERIPASQLCDMGAEKIVAVDVLGKDVRKSKHPSMFGRLLQMIDVIDNYRSETRRKENEKIIDLWVEPRLNGVNQYSLKQLSFTFRQGYEAGLKAVPKIKDICK